MSEAKGKLVWNRILDAALKMPGSRVDRGTFLSASFGPHLPAEVVRAAIDNSPAEAGVPEKLIREASRSAVSRHRTAVSATSALAAMPGRWWLAATIPTDLAQFFYHSVVLAQKLAYLHGWPSLVDKEKEIDEETKAVLTMFVGVMLGAHGAAAGITRLAGAMAARQLPKAVVGQYALYGLSKQIAKWVGIKLTRRRFTDMAGRSVPVLGGLFAGSVTWLLFSGGARRLSTHLESLPLAAPRAE